MPLRRPFAPHVPHDTHDVDPEDFAVPFDTPPTDEVLQSEEPEPEIQPVPVRLVNKVRVDQLPTELGITKSYKPSTTSPEKVLPRNPRRATVNLWVAGGGTFRVARTQAEAIRDDSSIIIGGNSGPFRFHWVDECWAMQREAGAATDRLVVCTEDWAR
jgi:hypothetical protein